VGAIAGPGIPTTGATTYTMFHATDWLPTLVSMAAGREWTDFISPSEPKYELGDGINLWPVLTGAVTDSPRQWLLLECHPDGQSIVHGNAFIYGDMKIVKLGDTHPQAENGNFPPTGVAVWYPPLPPSFQSCPFATRSGIPWLA
jgi:hypothetical protein